MHYTGLAERTVRTCLDRLAAEGIISLCDPDIVAARIKRADRRPGLGSESQPGLRRPGRRRCRRHGAPVPRSGQQTRRGYAAGGSLVHHLSAGPPVEEVTVTRPHLNVLAGRPGDRLRGLLAQAAQAGGGRSASGVTR